MRLAPCLLLLASCGASGAPLAPSVARIASVPALADPDLLGWTERGAEATTVLVLAGLPEVDAVATIAHELLHVAGFDTHATDPACVGWPTVQPWLVEPCPEEIEAMRGVGRTFTLEPTGDLLPATVEAAAFWNRAVGFDLFVVA